MTPKQREALQMALETLEAEHGKDNYYGYANDHSEEITALCEALSEPDIPEGWLRAIDEALVSFYLGVANAEDDYETAKKKLNELIQWNVDVAVDPRVNGGLKLVPIEPTEKMIDEGAQGMASFDEGTSWPESFDRLQVKRMRMDAKKAWRYMIAAAPEYKE